MMSNDSVPESDQPGLVERIRRGDDAAFSELFQEHETAVRGLARRLVADPSDAEDVTAETFFRVFQAIRRGSGPRENVRAYLLTVARRVSWEWQAARREVPVTDEELMARTGTHGDSQNRTAESALITRAFTSLPERWRTVLWHTEVEGEQPAVIAPYFGLSANATAALARRARIGLRAAYLQAHLATDRSSSGCRRVVRKLGGYTAGSVTGVEARRIRNHLSACSSCRSTHDELLRVSSSLRAHASVLLALVPLSGLTLVGSKVYAGAGVAAAAGGSATMSGVAAGGGAGAGVATATALTGSKLGLTFASAAAVMGMSSAPMLDDLAGRHAEAYLSGDGAVMLSSTAATARSFDGSAAAVDHVAEGRDDTDSATSGAETEDDLPGPTEFTLPAETFGAESSSVLPVESAEGGTVSLPPSPSRGSESGDETRDSSNGRPRDDTGSRPTESAGTGSRPIEGSTTKSPSKTESRPNDGADSRSDLTGPPPWAGPRSDSSPLADAEDERAGTWGAVSPFGEDTDFPSS